MKSGKHQAVAAAAAKARAAASAASNRARATEAAHHQHHEAHPRHDERKGSHRGAVIRLGPLDGRRMLRSATPPRQSQRRSAVPRSQSSQIDDLGQDDWVTASLVAQQEAMKVAASAGSRSMGESSDQRDGNEGGGSKQQHERSAPLLQALRAWQRQPQAQQDSEQAAAIGRRLFAAAEGAGQGPDRRQLLSELAAQYRAHAASPPGGGLQAVRQQLVSIAPFLGTPESASAFESSLNCLMPLLLLNLQRRRPPSMLGLAVAKATALSGRSDAPAIATAPTSTWGHAP